MKNYEKAFRRILKQAVQNKGAFFNPNNTKNQSVRKDSDESIHHIAHHNDPNQMNFMGKLFQR